MVLHEKSLRVVCLSSGGIDSSVILHMLNQKKYEILPLYIDYGHKSVQMEIKSLMKICYELKLEPKIIKLDELRTISSGLTDSNISHIDSSFFPNRNLLLLTIAASYAYQNSINIVSIGLLDNMIFPDQNKEFVSNAEKTISISLGQEIKILTPLIELDKREVVGLAKKHKIPLEFTYSCYSGKSLPCGNCKACVERKLAMNEPVL